eukprot:2108877-Prymnesium_polylepis.1
MDTDADYLEKLLSLKEDRCRRLQALITLKEARLKQLRSPQPATPPAGASPRNSSGDMAAPPPMRRDSSELVA